jgi:hypothetical protein
MHLGLAPVHLTAPGLLWVVSTHLLVSAGCYECVPDSTSMVIITFVIQV